ncbi:hypothetical protein RB195_016592 [Necator americanus]|uniref:Reverse transcriptase domain-containing protein n=1 Tax=Necator americanus TaxID=51031 RepID=A0ABR1C3K7_NECAM
MGYSERYLSWFTFFVLVCQGISSDLCRNTTIEIQRSYGFDSLADFLNAAVDYSKDPCEDFYQFACGKWMTEGKEPVVRLAFAQFRDSIKKINAILKAFFVSEEESRSKSVSAMREVYRNCLSSDEDWKSDGGPIKFVLERIQKYGYFPLIDGDERETDIDRTLLFVHFNKNKAVVKSILPVIGLNYRDNISQVMISFNPRYDFPDAEPRMIYGNRTLVYPSFDELLFTVSMKICSEIRAKCNETSIRQGVKEMLSVVEKVHGLRSWISHFDGHQWLRLSELNDQLSSVNWTKYFIMMAPPDTHSYFLADPLVHVPNRKYIEELDGILQNTPKRVLANFVILHYILSWANYLNDDYRTLLKEYMLDLGVKNFPSKSTFCFTVTTRIFDAAFTSVYGQKFNGSANEKLVEKLIREIFASFKERIKENKWMTREQKEFAILKAERMRIYAAYEDFHLNDSELDNRHKDLIELQHLKFLELLDKYDYSRSISHFRRLLKFDALEVFVPSLLAREEELTGPFYDRDFNMMVIPVSFLHMPLFHNEYPVYEEEKVKAFYMNLEKFYREDHAFYKVIIGDFNAEVGPRRTPEELHIGTHGLQWNDQREVLSEFIMKTETIHGNSQFQKPSSLRWTWEPPGGGYRNEIDYIIVNKRFCLTDVAVVPKFYTGSDHRLLRGRFSFTRRAEKPIKYRRRNPRTIINWDLFATLAGFWEDSAMDNIDEEYDRPVEHLHDCAKKAESFETTKRRLSLETLEMIRQRGAARAAGNQELTSELARLCREAIKEDLKERRAEVLAEAAEAGKSIRYARRDFASRKTRMTALRNPKGTAIASRRGMEKIIHDFYSDLFDSHVHLPPHHLREDGQVIPEVLPSEIRHAVMSVRNRTAPGPDRIRSENLKSLPPVLINTMARLFTRYLSECKVPKQWKTSKTVLYKKGDSHDIGNYRPICLLSVIYKLFTRVILNRIEKVLDEGQPCELSGFRKGFSTIDHIHTVSKLIEVSREYKMPLCLTFINLKKAFDSVETEAVVEALDNQGVPTQYIKVLRELYSNFTTGISPFYKNIIIDVKTRVRQGDTISPKIFTATLENAMRKLEWDDMGVNVDGRQLHHLRFADDIVLITPSISQAERMLTEFDETCGCIGLQLNLQKTMFMRNGWVSDAPFTLNGTNISECTSFVYLGRELNMMNDLTPELGRRRRAAWGAYKSIEDVVKKTRNTRLRAHLFNTTVLPALTYASETWAFRKQEENAVGVIERAIERVMLGVSRFTQVRDGIQSSLLRQRSKIRDAAAFAKQSKIRRTTGRPPTRWSDFFTKSFKEKYDALRVSREMRSHWVTLARDRDKWKNYWRPLDQFEDQRESSSYSYGSIGSIIAHEIIHGFDINGIKYDENGNRRPFKKKEWHEFFKGVTCLKKQYKNSVIPGSKLKPNAGRTLSENMADVEGVRQSFVKEEGYREEGRIWTTEDITADQLFFLGWGIILCGKFSEEELKAIILWDTHSPPVLRVNNVVANVEGFADAFRCSPDSPMNPKNRCSIF